MLNGTRKCRRDLLFHFIRACGVRKDSEVLGWLEAWDRVEAYRNGTAGSRMQQRLAAIEEEVHNTKAALEALALPGPRQGTEVVQDVHSVDTGHPHPVEPVTAPTREAREHTKQTRTRARRWLPRLARGIAAIFY
ncbi:hypothetical protein ACFV30_40310 [Streptomyces sp. NPDC059752]|uniref:hypothetical protein n=1 Tax=unclassified Streptomyces TaxID=2593676 RepID=UPI00365A9356